MHCEDVVNRYSYKVGFKKDAYFQKIMKKDPRYLGQTEIDDFLFV